LGGGGRKENLGKFREGFEKSAAKKLRGRRGFLVPKKRQGPF